MDGGDDVAYGEIPATVLVATPAAPAATPAPTVRHQQALLATPAAPAATSTSGR